MVILYTTRFIKSRDVSILQEEGSTQQWMIGLMYYEKAITKPLRELGLFV